MPKIIDDDFDESNLFSGVPQPVAQPSGNPLSGYFRMPGLSIGLPTGGRFLPKGAIQLDAKGQVEVYPMRSADELLLKSPDALMNGLAIERLIESCIPAIKTPGLVSAPDLDVILLAIRAATYGNMMSVEVECPECQTELSFECDLAAVLATMTELPEDLSVRLSEEVVVHLRPLALSSQTKLLLAAFEEQRRAQMADESTDDEYRQRVLRETFDRLTQYQSQSVSDAIDKVVVPNTEVTDRLHILEFVKNMNKVWSSKLQTRIEEINSMGMNRDIDAQCGKCKHAWKTKLEFNPATFFELGS